MGDRLSFQWYDIERDPQGWDDRVAVMGESLFHRNAMLEAHQTGKAFRRGVLMRRGQHAVGLIGGLLLPGMGAASFQSLSFSRPRQELGRELPSELGEWLLRQGVTRIDLGSYDGGVEGYGEGRVGMVTERFEFVYDLKRSEEERLRVANSNHRRKLKKSEREPMHLRRIELGPAMLMTRLNRSWARRKGERYGFSRVMHTYLFYRRLTGRLGRDGSANLYGLYDMRGTILSMAYMLERGGSSFYMIGASSNEGYERGAAVRLFWELARHYPQVGVHSMNFGGVPIGAREESHQEHGVYRFKQGFGVEPVVRKSLTIGA